MSIIQILQMAFDNVENNFTHKKSAWICYYDALTLFNDGDISFSRSRALKSLKYSVGILSPIYKKASA